MWIRAKRALALSRFVRPRPRPPKTPARFPPLPAWYSLAFVVPHKLSLRGFWAVGCGDPKCCANARKSHFDCICGVLRTYLDRPVAGVHAGARAVNRHLFACTLYSRANYGVNRHSSDLDNLQIERNASA